MVDFMESATSPMNSTNPTRVMYLVIPRRLGDDAMSELVAIAYLGDI